ncbi:hypothetical protein ABT392_05455 [Paucibacter sp. JuS9]|uniref:hypothetical protein n=1 Tax=Paucibacter sp. JuS9 TaxID=3228748 RepID=UPI0037579A47
MPMFTVVLDYRGGTYISQLRAPSVRTAQIAWAKSLEPGVVFGLGAKRLVQLVQEIEQDPYGIYAPVALRGLTNAWCCGSPYGLLNIIKTDSTQ